MVKDNRAAQEVRALKRVLRRANGAAFCHCCNPSISSAGF
ncbi:hypothetical protein NC652_029318 [Populus alba x Populus x berolinensis]|nr:hypothetical protein NC652_029318 [Populus alba x Populus x berolinensis]